MQFDNQKTRNVAEAVKKILAGETVSEELKGNQHKIDKNKNNKIDAHDFELLRKEKGVKQEASCDKMKKEETDLNESHFKVGDEVKCKASGMEGEVVKVDEPQTGKYYTVKREDGKTMKYAPDELKLDEATKPEETKFHKDLDKLVHKTFGKRKDEMKEDKEKNYRQPGFNNPRKYTDDLGIMGKKYMPLKYKDKIKEESEELDEATPSRQQVKQAIGIARDKRYAGGNMTGAVKAMQKLNKGLAQHPAVEKELKKQNEEAEQLDEYTPDKSGVTRIQGRAYGASKPEKHAVDTMSGPTRKELTAIEKEKKVKKPFKEMLELYSEKGLKALSEMTMTEEPDQEQFEKELVVAKKKATEKKSPEDEAKVAKSLVHSVQQEEVEQIDEKEMSDAEMKKREDIVMGMKKNLKGFKDRYGARAKDVMYATATKQAMKEDEE